MVESGKKSASHLGLEKPLGDQPSPFAATGIKKSHPREHPFWGLARDPEQRSTLLGSYQAVIRDNLPPYQQTLADWFFENSDRPRLEIIKIIAAENQTAPEYTRNILTGIFNRILKVTNGPNSPLEPLSSPPSLPSRDKGRGPSNFGVFRDITTLLTENPVIADQMFPPDNKRCQVELELLKKYYGLNMSARQIHDHTRYKVTTIEQYLSNARNRIREHSWLMPGEITQQISDDPNSLIESKHPTGSWLSEQTIIQPEKQVPPTPPNLILPINSEWESMKESWIERMQQELDSRIKRGTILPETKPGEPAPLEYLSESWVEFWRKFRGNITQPQIIRDTAENYSLAARLNLQNLTLAYIPEELCYSPLEALETMSVIFNSLNFPPVLSRLLESISLQINRIRIIPGWRIVTTETADRHLTVSERITNLTTGNRLPQTLVEYLTLTVYKKWWDNTYLDPEYEGGYVDLTGEKQSFGVCTIKNGNVALSVGLPANKAAYPIKVRGVEPLKF